MSKQVIKKMNKKKRKRRIKELTWKPSRSLIWHKVIPVERLQRRLNKLGYKGGGVDYNYMTWKYLGGCHYVVDFTSMTTFREVIQICKDMDILKFADRRRYE